MVTDLDDNSPCNQTMAGEGNVLLQNERNEGNVLFVAMQRAVESAVEGACATLWRALWDAPSRRASVCPQSSLVFVLARQGKG